MITKQQALEFIYELYNQTTVYVNLQKGKMFADVYVDYEEGITGTYTAYIGFKPQSNEGNLLEELVTEFIKVNQDSSLFNNFDKIPVDVDMLKVGQTYKVEFLDFTGIPNSFTEKLLSITEEDKPVFNFSNGYYTKYIDIKEIYKVNACID